MNEGVDRRHEPGAPSSRPATGSADAWLIAVADAASKDSGGVPVDLLGDYLPMLADAAINGRRPRAVDLEAINDLGIRAAEQISKGWMDRRISGQNGCVGQAPACPHFRQSRP